MTWKTQSYRPMIILIMDNYDWQHLVLTWSIVFVFKQLLNGN